MTLTLSHQQPHFAEDDFSSFEPPLCPMLDYFQDKKLDIQAIHCAKVISQVIEVWERVGVTHSRIRAPILSDILAAGRRKALNYELANRIARHLMSNDHSVRLRHFANDLNIIEIQSTKVYKRERQGFAHGLAQELLTTLYDGAVQREEGFHLEVRHEVNRHLTQLVAPIIKNLAPDLDISPRSQQLIETTWKYVKNQIRYPGGKWSDCLWHMGSGRIQVKVLKEAPSVLKKLTLRIAGWRPGESYQPSVGWCC